MHELKHDYKTIIDLFRFVAANYHRKNLLNHRVNGAWRAISTAEFAIAVEDFALGLIGLGLAHGEGVGLSAPSSPFWVVADLAVSLAGGVTVPIFNRISPENLAFGIEDAALNIMIVGDQKEYEPVRACGRRLRKIITIGFNRADSLAAPSAVVQAAGSKMREADPGRYVEAFARPLENDLFTIIYTSGSISMGRPKGFCSPIGTSSPRSRSRGRSSS
jgi:long-chain acyl-CoA synthetase